MKKILTIMGMTMTIMFSSIHADEVQTQEDDWVLACTEDEVNSYGLGAYTIAGSGNQYVVAVDKEHPYKYDRKKGLITVAVAYVATKEGQLAAYKSIGTPEFGLNKSVKEFDIKNRRVRSLSFSFYNCDGSMIVQQTYTDKWSYILPGSLDQGVLDELVSK